MNVRRSSILIVTLALATAGCAVDAGRIDPREIEMRAALDRSLAGNVSFRDATFAEVAERLSKSSGVTVVFADSFTRGDGSPATNALGRITADVTGLRLGHAVTSLLPVQDGDPFKALGASVRNGVVTIDRRAKADAQNLVLRTYDVRDLIDAAAARDKKGLTDREYGNVCFPPETAEAIDERGRAAQDLIRLVKEAIGYDEWSEGDGHGKASEYGGRLVVSQTLTNHARVRALLSQLRRPTRP